MLVSFFWEENVGGWEIRDTISARRGRSHNLNYVGDIPDDMSENYISKSSPSFDFPRSYFRFITKVMP